MIAYARAPTPQTIQRTLLARKSQKPQRRLRSAFEATSQEERSVTAIAGHWTKSRVFTACLAVSLGDWFLA